MRHMQLLNPIITEDKLHTTCISMQQYVCGQYIWYGFIFHPFVHSMKVAHVIKV
jgi:hypothetical protein